MHDDDLTNSQAEREALLEEDALRADEPKPEDYEPLPAEDVGKACTLCACDAVVVLFGFRTCGYHSTNGEDARPCVVCATNEAGR